jgi:hypothetical protein
MPIAITPRGGGLKRSTSTTVFELSSSRSSDESPRLAVTPSSHQQQQIAPDQVMPVLAQALPAPTAAFITDTQITRLIYQLMKTHGRDTALTSSLRTLSIYNTHDPKIVNAAFATFSSVFNSNATLAAEREQISQQSTVIPITTRILAWQSYHTAIMHQLNIFLQQKMPGIVTANNKLYFAFNDPVPTEFSAAQISYLQQHLVTYAYMLTEQERMDPELYTKVYARQLTQYQQFLASLQQFERLEHLKTVQMIKPVGQTLLKPLAISVTDLAIELLIQEHEANTQNILTEILRCISAAKHSQEQLDTANALFMSILTKIDGPRQLALDQSKKVDWRAECWLGYHLTIMHELNQYLISHIPTINTDNTRLYLGFINRTPTTITPVQINHIITYILAYALMLSEQETLDPEAFKVMHKKQIACVDSPQNSPTTRRKRGSSIGSGFDSLRKKLTFKKSDGAASSSNS